MENAKTGHLCYYRKTTAINILEISSECHSNESYATVVLSRMVFKGALSFEFQRSLHRVQYLSSDRNQHSERQKTVLFDKE